MKKRTWLFLGAMTGIAAAIQACHQAIAAYTSQIPTFFLTFDALAEQLPALIAEKGGEWLWRKVIV